MHTVYALLDGVLVPCRHGSLATADLRKDFTPALESIRYLECTDVRSALQKEAAMASVELSRRYAASLAPNSAPTKQSTQSKARKKSQHRNVEVPALKMEYWP